MRTIKFRGKRKSDQTWIYGSLICPANENQKYRIAKDYSIDNIYEVDPESIGEFTGFIAKENVEVYEGDILRVCDDVDDEFIVEYSEGSFRMLYEDVIEDQLDDVVDICGVYGNIYDRRNE